MRLFLNTTASATFFGNAKCTARIMKDHIEFIFKLQSGVYSVVLVLPADRDSVALICNWGLYFEKRLRQVSNASAVIGRIQSKCPKTASLLTGDEEPISEMSLQLHTGEWLKGIGTEVKLSAPMMDAFSILGDKSVIDTAFRLNHFVVEIYSEIQKQCPIPGWRDGLQEIWQ